MNGYISIKQVLDNLLNHPLLKDLTLERAINYAQEFIRIVGCPKLFLDKIVNLHIDNYRALLPCDLVNVLQVIGNKGEEYRYTTDFFHTLQEQQKTPTKEEHTYKIQGNIIYTSIKEGDIKIAYQSIALDDEGFPCIPDNASFIKALELYIKKQWFTILFDMGKINANVYQNVQQEYGWYVGQAQSDLIKPTWDEMESLTNMWITLIQRVKDHRNGFRDLGTKEYLRIQ